LTLLATPSAPETKALYRVVKYTFYKVDPAWRRLLDEERKATKRDLLATLSEYTDHIAPRAYSLVGTRGDADFMLWTITNTVDDLQTFSATILKTGLGKFLSTPYSYLAMIRPSEYFGKTTDPDPVGSKYLFVYPFTKKREWYSIPFEERRRIMREHVQIGHKYSSVTIHTSYCFGLDDYEFILSFETDYPEDFLNLVMDLRSSEASKYTAIETPIFTCVSVTPEKMLDLLGP
jgi:chlorite dismutase